jgi:hypothetical protein
VTVVIADAEDVGKADKLEEEIDFESWFFNKQI